MEISSWVEINDLLWCTTSSLANIIETSKVTHIKHVHTNGHTLESHSTKDETLDMRPLPPNKQK
jgi:hypothetical protein